MKSKLALRSVNKAFKSQVEGCEQFLFKYWTRDFMDEGQLRAFSQDVKVVKGRTTNTHLNLVVSLSLLQLYLLPGEESFMIIVLFL